MGTTADKLNYTNTNLRGSGGILPTLQAKGVISDAGASLASIKAAVAAYSNDPAPPYFTGNYQRLRRGANITGRGSQVDFAISANIFGTPTVTAFTADGVIPTQLVDVTSLWYQEEDPDEFGVNTWYGELDMQGAPSPDYNGDIILLINFEYATGQRGELCHIFHYTT